MATFSLTFKTNTAAFNDRYEYEVASIFEKVQEQVEDGIEQARVYDSDDNAIGWFSSDFDPSMLEEIDGTD